MTGFVKRVALLSCGSLAAISLSTAGHAQDASAQPAAAEDNVGKIADIVVTAEKRETKIQQTPIAMRAIDGTALAKSGIADIRTIERLAPDITVSTDSSNTRLAMRGVSASDNNESADPAFAVNIDGDYINRPKGLGAAFFDLERIEILRGPQGTLYGRNSTAGTMNIIAAKPKLGSLEGSASLGYGNYNAKLAQGMLNVPLGDTAAFRIAGQHLDHDGYRNNTPAGRGETQNVDSVRASIAAEPSDTIKLYLAGEYSNVNQTNQSRYTIPVNATTPGVVDLNPATATVEGLIPSLVQIPANADFSTFPLDSLGFVRSTLYAVRGKVEADLGVGTLSYIAGYRRFDSAEQQNLNGFPTTLTFNTPRANIRSQSHELRFNGDAGGVKWQAGLFYFKETQDVIAYAYGDARFSPAVVNPSGVVTQPAGRFLNYFFRPDIKSQSYAAFAQVIVPVGHNLNVTGGVRYTVDRKEGTFINLTGSLFGATPPSINGANMVHIVRKSGSEVPTWSIGFDWHPAPDSMVYGKISKGYKAGGFDNVGEFKPETLIAYEIGTKNQFFDRTLQFNASFFYYDYRNQQVSALIDAAVGAQVFNAGKSRIWGIETETRAVLGDFDSISLTVNYLDAKFIDFPASLPTVSGNGNDFNADLPGVQAPNLAGNRPRFSPKWTVAVGYDHTFEIGESKVIASVFSRYRSDYFNNPFNWVSMKVDGYTQTDLNLEYIAPGDKFSLKAYVRNLENKSIPSAVDLNGGAIGVLGIYLQPPRTYGVQVTYKF